MANIKLKLFIIRPFLFLLRLLPRRLLIVFAVSTLVSLSLMYTRARREEIEFELLNKGIHVNIENLTHLYKLLDEEYSYPLVKLVQKWNIFENESENQLFKLYQIHNQKANINNLNQFKYKQVDKRLKENLSKKFYLIVEYTRFNEVTKYCHLKFKSNILKRYQYDENFIRYFDSTSSLQHYNENQTYDHLDKCKFKNCLFTCDKEWLFEADAVVFNQADLDDEYKNSKILFEMFKLTRNPNQIWILYNDDYNKVPLSADKFMFNWTVSPRIDAEASYCAYGCYKPLDKKIDKKTFENFIKNEFKERKPFALWFNSNCFSKARLKFGGMLANYFRTIIFGSCNWYTGAYIFGRYNYFTLNYTECKKDSKCEYDAYKMAKFYLAFEPKNCSNYITEKLWHTLETGAIPVVFQPSKKDYEIVAPKNSFIHAEDFNYDVKKLAAYLNQVSNNYNLYYKHRKWNMYYQVVYKKNEIEQYRLCELCSKINSETSSMHYKSISNWYNQKCYDVIK